MSGRARAAAIGVSLLLLFYVTLGSVLGRTASEGAYTQLAVFSEVLTHIREDYVETPNISRVTAGALNGLLASLDPYSSYLSPREYAKYREKKQAQAPGDVGLILSKRFGLISVVTVLPDSPAARAGMLTGDLLESLAGFSTREMSVEQAYFLLAGEIGTVVKLSVVRQARAEPQEVELVRARLQPTHVLSERLEEDIGYLKIAAFTAGRAAEVRAALRRLQNQGAEKLVLDLRDCASGKEEEAVETVRLLLDRGVITFLEGQQYPRRQFNAQPAQTVWNGPVTVLINHGTAGPAEIVAAAVMDNARGEVVGLRSYGVGSVQKIIPLEDGSALILSVAKYHRPTGEAIQDHAITPSVAVELPREQAVVPRPHALPPPDDPVLQKALEVLRGQPVLEQARKAG